MPHPSHLPWFDHTDNTVLVSDCQLLNKRSARNFNVSGSGFIETKVSTNGSVGRNVAAVCVTVTRGRCFAAVCTSIQSRVKFCYNRYSHRRESIPLQYSPTVCGFRAASSSSTDCLSLCISFSAYFLFLRQLSLCAARGVIDRRNQDGDGASWWWQLSLANY
jgi:hypothetical protein